MQFLLYLPAWLSIIIVGIFPVLLSVLGLKIVRRKFPSEILKENHEVAGYIFNAFGLIYAVLIAFVVYVSWTDYDNAKRNVELEANLLADLFMDSEGFPDTLKADVRTAILEYTNYVINDEWDSLGTGGSSVDARERLEKLWKVYLNTDIKALPNLPIYEESMKRLNDLGEYRRLRYFLSNDFIPGIIWFVLIVCAVSSVGYTFFFGTKNLRAQYVMTSVLTLINSFILFLIFVLDHPFTGYNRISTLPFEHVRNFLLHLMGGG